MDKNWNNGDYCLIHAFISTARGRREQNAEKVIANKMHLHLYFHIK